MSRLAKKPIPVPAGVTVVIDGARVAVKGPRGELAWGMADGMRAELAPGGLVVHRRDDSAAQRRLQGTTWSLLRGMVVGVSQGYMKELEIQGVGYKAVVQGQTVILTLGYSHPVRFEVPAGVKVEAPDATTLKISGCSKSLVGDVAARLRDFYRAEPYKGKGLRYKGEVVRRKAGKTVA